MADCRPHSFDEQRTQASQSTAISYSFALWAQGYNPNFIGSDGVGNFGNTAKVYAPINVLSSQSLFSTSSFLTFNNLSLDAWQCYDGDLNIGLDITGTLYQHASFSGLISNSIEYGKTPSSMLIVDVGTTSSYLSINISGSVPSSELDYAGVRVYYGKPWNTDGSNGTGSSTLVASYNSPITANFTYNYTYNSSSGSYLYFILLNGCPEC